MYLSQPNIPMGTIKQEFLEDCDVKQIIMKRIWNNVFVEIEQKQNNKVKTYFPLMRMKTIMKSSLDEHVGPITAEAAAAMSFMAELFIRELASLSWLESENRRSKIISKLDTVRAAKNYSHMDFLIDILPSRIPVNVRACPHKYTILTESKAACRDCGKTLAFF